MGFRYFGVSRPVVYSYQVIVSVRIGSTKIYGYDIPWFLWNVCTLDWLLSVLLCGHLAFITLADDLFYHAIHRRKPMLFSQHLFSFGHAKMSQVECCFNHLSLEACRNNNLVYPKNQVIHYKEFVTFLVKNTICPDLFYACYNLPFVF